MNEGIFQEYEKSKKNAPGWLKRLPKGLRLFLIKVFWLRSDLLDFIAEMIGRLPGHSLRVWLYRFLGVRIGKNTSIHRGCRFYNPSGVCIGNHTVINRDTLLDGRSGLEIGENVSISEGVIILTLEHDPDSSDFATRGGKVIIHDYTFIGARAIILPGVTLERGAVVAAGAVVTNNIHEYQIVGGVPARLIRKRNNDLHYELKYRKFLG